MKLRPVISIHIAAYLFSALVLGASAVSYFHPSVLRLHVDSMDFKVRFFHGQIEIVQSDVGSSDASGFHHEFYWLYSRPVPDPIDWFSQPPGPNEGRCLGIRWISFPSEGALFSQRTFHVYQIPFATLLIPPLAWICGFHLCKLRQHIRSRRAVKMNSVAP